MLRKILIGIAAVLIIAIAFLYYKTRPSGDINKYKEYFIDEDLTPGDSGVQVTFFGVSTLLIDDGQTQLMIDGFFSRYSMAKVLTSDVESDTAAIDKVIATFGINRLKGIFVTHSHYDHSFDAGYLARKTGATLHGSPSTLNIGRGVDVPENQLQEYQPNKDFMIGDLQVRVVPSIHSPGGTFAGNVDAPLRQPASLKTFLEGGSFDFLINHHGKSIYIKPSPNFIPGGLDSLHADVLFLGIATVMNYDSAWSNQFYEENVRALEPSMLVPLHWDDFFEPLSNHLVMLPKSSANVEQDFDFFIRRTKEDGIDFKILQGEASIVLFKP